jgi:hypothetical protein
MFLSSDAAACPVLLVVYFFPLSTGDAAIGFGPARCTVDMALLGVQSGRFFISKVTIGPTLPDTCPLLPIAAVNLGRCILSIGGKSYE